MNDKQGKLISLHLAAHLPSRRSHPLISSPFMLAAQCPYALLARREVDGGGSSTTTMNYHLFIDKEFSICSAPLLGTSLLHHTSPGRPTVTRKTSVHSEIVTESPLESSLFLAIETVEQVQILLNQRLRDSSERRSAGDAKKLFLEATHCHSERTFELLFHKISYHENTRPD